MFEGYGVDRTMTLKGFWRGFYAGLLLALLGHGVWTYCSSDNDHQAESLSPAVEGHEVWATHRTTHSGVANGVPEGARTIFRYNTMAANNITSAPTDRRKKDRWASFTTDLAGKPCQTWKTRDGTLGR